MKIGLTYDLRNDYLAEGYGEEETAEFDAPATIEEAHDLVSATLADESRADAALDKLRADFALAEKVAAARLYEAKGASSLARMHLRYLTAEKRHAQIEMGETARAAGLR